MTDAVQKFPAYMTHPNMRAATLGAGAQIGTPMRFPPVVVHDQTTLEYHESQGYKISGKLDPAAFVAAQAMPDGAAPMGHQEYPKYVGGVTVQNEDEEQARRMEMAEEEVQAAQRAKDEADRAAAAVPDDLPGQVAELRQGFSELKDMLTLLLDKATAPASQSGRQSRADRPA